MNKLHRGKKENRKLFEIVEGPLGPELHFGGRPTPPGLMVGMAGVSGSADFEDIKPEFDPTEEGRETIDYDRVRKLAEEMAHRAFNGKATAAEIRQFLLPAYRVVVDADYIAQGFVLKETYEYKINGKLLYFVDRYEHPLIKGAKQFPTRRLGSDGMPHQGTGRIKIPYHMDKLVDAEGVYHCEGEKDVHRMEELGFVATTMAGGHWSAEGAMAYAGKHVNIFQDNDNKGRENAANAVRALLGIARSIKVIKLPGLRRGEDVSDWLDPKKHNHTVEELLAFVSTAPSSGISIAPRKRIKPKDIPVRDWIAEPYYIRKFGSALVSPGAAGKSSLVIAEALALASGRKLLNIKPRRGGKYKVLYICGEDGIDELHRRFTAAMMFYGIEDKDIGDNLFYESGRTMPLILAETDRFKVRINEEVIDQLVEKLKEHKIDVLILDPLIDFHRVRESINEDMDPIIKRLNAIAEECNIAYLLVHHTRKAKGENGLTVDDARGASATMNAARIVRVINPMTDTEAKNAGIAPERRGFYFSTFNGKANLTPPSEARDWYEKKSFNLGNSDDPEDFEGESDKIAVVVSYTYPVVTLPTETPSTISLAVANVRAGGPWRFSPQARAWVGVPIAKALNADLSKPGQKKAISKLVRDWIAKDILKVVTRKDDQRREREFVEVGDSAEAGDD